MRPPTLARLLWPRPARDLLQRGALRFLARPRRSVVAGLELWAPPSVFHPGLFFSTRVFCDWILLQDLQGLAVLDLGTGSGALAIAAARNGATVTACDLNPRALVAAGANAARAGVTLRLRAGDGYAALAPDERFDLILCNPPWFEGEPRDEAERAFRGGAGMRFVEELFAGLSSRLRDGGRLVSVLGASADRRRIDAIASRHGYRPQRLCSRRVCFELQTVDAWRLVGS